MQSGYGQTGASQKSTVSTGYSATLQGKGKGKRFGDSEEE